MAIKKADIDCTDIVTAEKIGEALLRFGDDEGKPPNVRAERPTPAENEQR